MSDYHSIGIPDAKEKLLRIFSGGEPKSEIPFLWKLKDEIDDAADLLLNLHKYEQLNRFFCERDNRKYSRFAYIMA